MHSHVYRRLEGQSAQEIISFSIQHCAHESLGSALVVPKKVPGVRVGPWVPGVSMRLPDGPLVIHWGVLGAPGSTCGYPPQMLR